MVYLAYEEDVEEGELARWYKLVDGFQITRKKILLRPATARAYNALERLAMRRTADLAILDNYFWTSNYCEISGRLFRAKDIFEEGNYHIKSPLLPYAVLKRDSFEILMKDRDLDYKVNF